MYSFALLGTFSNCNSEDPGRKKQKLLQSFLQKEFNRKNFLFLSTEPEKTERRC
jgi:hypothetical protein